MTTIELGSGLTGFSNYDEARANIDTVTLLTVSASGTTNGSITTNPNWVGGYFYVNITTLTGTSPTLTVSIQGRDPVTATYYTILASSALAATGFTVLQIYPGSTIAANSVANAMLPRSFRATATTGGTITTIAATVTCSLVV